MTAQLKDINDAFCLEVDEIESNFHQCGNMSPIATYQVAYIPAVEGCITALWDAWSRFNRSLLLTSASSPVKGISGSLYTPRHNRSEQQALRKLDGDSRDPRNKIKLSGGEPIWAAPEMLLDVCQSLELPALHPLHGAVTSHSLSLPLGASASNPISEIRKVRNFCAHKGKSTYGRMRTHLRPGILDAHSHVRQKVGGISRFSHWVDCLKTISEAASS